MSGTRLLQVGLVPGGRDREVQRIGLGSAWGMLSRPHPSKTRERCCAAMKKQANSIDAFANVRRRVLVPALL